MNPYIFEIRVPVACIVSFGDNHRKEISCVPGDLVRIPIFRDDIYANDIQIYVPYDESKEV